MVLAKGEEKIVDGGGKGKSTGGGADDKTDSRKKRSVIQSFKDEAYGVNEDGDSSDNSMFDLDLKGAEDFSWQIKATPDENSSWGAAAATSKTVTRTPKNTDDTQEKKEVPLFIGDHLLMHILPHLPIAAKVRFTCASKHWKSLLDPLISEEDVQTGRAHANLGESLVV